MFPEKTVLNSELKYFPFPQICLDVLHSALSIRILVNSANPSVAERLFWREGRWRLGAGSVKY